MRKFCCLLLITLCIPVYACAQWAREIGDFQLLLNADTLHARQIKSCKLKAQNLDDAWFNKHWQTPMMDLLQQLDFDTSGRLQHYCYYGVMTIDYWRNCYAYDEQGRLTEVRNEHIQNTTVKKTSSQEQYTYRNGQLQTFRHDDTEEPDQSYRTRYYYTGDRPLCDSSWYTCDSCMFYSPHPLYSELQWQGTGTYKRIYEVPGESGPLRITEEREYPGGRLLYRQDKYSAEQYYYSKDGRLESVTIRYPERADTWPYGCGFGIKKKDLRGHPAPAANLCYTFIYSGGLISRVDITGNGMRKGYILFEYTR